MAPGGQVQRAAHVLRQQDGASGGKLGELLPSGYVKIAIENGHRNSGFSH